uniref:CSON000821 protein n=1 Tax=Culicoides sonorensis TaxID=179676 RepID=A0A336MFE1_CULSO
MAQLKTEPRMEEEGMEFVVYDQEGEDDEEEGAGYFVDQAGNYYYRAHKGAEPVPSAPPQEEENEEEGPMETIEELNENEESDMQYVLIMPDGKGKSDFVDANMKLNFVFSEGEKEVYDFEDEEAEAEVDEKGNILTVVKKRNNAGQSEATHMCNYCNYTTSKRYLLSRHMKSHSDDRPHKCSVCERGFKTVASLQNHVNTHTGTKPHSCKFCEMSFTTSGELVRHVRYRHTHEKPHKCSECDYASVELSKLKRHIRCHTGERPYQCPHCTYASPDTFKLKRHLRIHTGEKPYECDICKARFTQSNSLKAHKLIHSVGDKPVFQCELCPTTCGRKTDLRIHVQKLHTADKPLKCKRCDQEFPDRYTYKLHTKTHDGEKCFKCDLCPYASISARHLESHLLIHTDQKPFQCEQCDQAFRQKQLLKRHFNLYHNQEYVAPAPKEKTHVCPTCSRPFRHKGNLIRHMAIHDPDAEVHKISQELKEGRQKRIQIIDGQEVVTHVKAENDTEDEDEDSMDMEQEEQVVRIEGEDGHQYVVLEVIQMQNQGETAEEGTSSNVDRLMNDDFLLNDELPETTLADPIKTEKLGDDNNDCFGFENLARNCIKIGRNHENLRKLQLIRTFTEHRMTVNGHEVNYVKTGKEISDDNLILLPGALGSALTDFGPQLEKLPKLLPTYTIIGFTPPGYGKNRAEERYFGLDFFERDALNALTLMQHLEINKFDVLGWSDGGITGMILAGFHEFNVRKLVVWGANAYIHPDEVKIYEGIRDVSKWSEKMRKPMEDVYGKEGFQQLWSEWVDTILGFYHERQGNICKEHLEVITAPTLIVHGAKDPMIVPEHVPYLLEHIKNSELYVFEEGKHNIHLRFADKFNEVVAEFLLRDKED